MERLFYPLLLLLLIGCLKKSESIKTESGVVIDKQYSPDTRESVVGSGFSTSGNIIVTSHQIGEAEKYIVIFKCAHGSVFSIKSADIYGRLEKGDSVNISYHDLINGSGEVKDYKFINAEKK